MPTTISEMSAEKHRYIPNPIVDTDRSRACWKIPEFFSSKASLPGVLGGEFQADTISSSVMLNDRSAGVMVATGHTFTTCRTYG
jgi:hypothetical protein